MGIVLSNEVIQPNEPVDISELLQPRTDTDIIE